ncbi:uncharacterized protein LOC100838460 isoform X2 [Brachypodium distachyon]|uniref:Rho termination factor-like N-terminal domain-containing protein n=1 Tax=Brachypodium distachyon TaxID=15368 RepID=I1HD44_BRADI|nr:uncharacterized protein LOC100838460 isoform X2 [Brachypodium distachyon]KQK03234.1 hypothetical protein BRADI_2g06460v3 [Brachypodium distachyon]|eukprot:XP_003565249.1 uncharacterized protein LOC100838460 isoform X2 [Brachypodium distachyon]
MGGILMQHHQISPSPLRKDSFPGSFSALLKGGVLPRAPRQGFRRSSPAVTVRSEVNGSPSLPRTVRRHSKEELMDFFGSIQAAIARDSPKASKRTRNPSSPAPDSFEDAGRMTKQTHGELGRDGQPDLKDMKVPELRELARARLMRGYSKLKKGELIDRLKGGLV